MEILDDSLGAETIPQRMFGRLVGAVGTLACKIGLRGESKLGEIENLDLGPIRLIKDSSGFGLVLAGLKPDEVEITPRVVNAILRDGTLSPYFVERISERRLGSNRFNEEDRRKMMIKVRDELNEAKKKIGKTND